MSSRFSLEATVSMIDKVTGPMKNASGAVAGFSKKTQAAFGRADISAKKINKSINRVGGRAAKGGLLALGAGAGFVTRQFVHFDDAIFAASAKFKGLDITTKQGAKTMEELRKTARRVGADTKFNAVDAAQGLDFLAMAGLNATQSMAALPGVTNLATVANVDLATATDIASDTLGAFNLMTEDSVQLQKNLARVNDVTAKTTTVFNTDLETLFEAVKKGAPTFTAAGQSIESFSALSGVMAEAGVKGSESGTQLRNMMLRLAAPTGEAAKLLSKMGISVKDSQGNFRDVIDILADFESGTKGMGTATKTAALANIFGARSVTGMNILLAKGADKLKGYRDMLLQSGGAAQKMADIITQSAGNKLRALGSAATEAGFKIISAFAGKGKAGIDSLTEAIRNINPQPIIAALSAFLTILGAVFTVIKIIAPFVDIIVASFVTFKAVMLVSAASTFLFGTAINFASAPMIIIVGVIALIISGVFRLIRMWDKLVATFKREGFFSAIAEFFGFGGGEVNLNKKTTMEGAPITPRTPGAGFASPQSRTITNNNNTNTSGTLGIDITAPKGTATVNQSGQMPQGFLLNTGLDG